MEIHILVKKVHGALGPVFLVKRIREQHSPHPNKLAKIGKRPTDAATFALSIP